MRNFKENLYTDGCIRTNSGIYFDILNPNEEMVVIEDIAYSLSKLPRFGGHLNVDWSVASHSLLVSHSCPNYPLEGLLHDASEAYLMDLPTPIKKILPQYYEIEDRICRVIAGKFGLTYPWPNEVKEADKKALHLEWDSMMLGKIVFGDESRSYIDFIDTFKTFTNEK